MKTKIVEATEGSEFNYGKFLVGRLDVEWARRQVIEGAEDKWPLLRTIGMSPDAVLVLDLQTGEGAMFVPGGIAAADLDRHRIWCCPMYEHFLTWLYKQDLTDLDTLPDTVNLGDVPTAFRGYRRAGPEDVKHVDAM